MKRSSHHAHVVRSLVTKCKTRCQPTTLSPAYVCHETSGFPGSELRPAARSVRNILALCRYSIAVPTKEGKVTSTIVETNETLKTLTCGNCIQRLDIRSLYLSRRLV